MPLSFEVYKPGEMKFLKIICLAFLFSSALHAQRVMENLGRGVVALRQPDGKVFVSWRLLGTEKNNLVFNLYRSLDGGKPEKLNKQPLIKGTNFIDDLID